LNNPELLGIISYPILPIRFSNNYSELLSRAQKYINLNWNKLYHLKLILIYRLKRSLETSVYKAASSTPCVKSSLHFSLPYKDYNNHI